jgi:hypothetical protein
MSSIEDSYCTSLLSFMQSKMPQSSSCVSSRQSAGRWESCTAALGLQEVVAQLDSDLNETYLWHGTRVRTGLQIAQDDHRCHPKRSHITHCQHHCWTILPPND